MALTEAEAYVLGEFEKREIPKLGGSSAAFIVLIVLLLLVILVAGGGIVYLLREDESTSADRWRVQRRMGVPKVTVAHGDLDDDDEEAGGHRSRGVYRRQGSSDSAVPHEGGGSGGWAASVKRLFWKARRKTGRGRRHQAGDSSMLPTSDSSMLSPPLRRYSANPAPSGRQQGWMPAASESDWDLHQQTPTNFNSAPSNMRMGMVERRQTDSPVLSTNTHNLNTSPRSSYISGGPSHSYPSSYPYPYSTSRMTTSDSMHSGSVVRFDDSVNVPRRHSGAPGGGAGGGGPAPSILSGRYFASPTTSPTGSSTALPLASPTGMSPRSGSPSPVHQYPSHSFSSPTASSPVVSAAAPSAHASTSAHAPAPPSSSSSHGASSHSAGAPIRPGHPKQLPSRMTMTSASEVSLASASDSYSYPSHEYVLANHSPFPAPSPSIRTFGSGSRFVEGL